MENNIKITGSVKVNGASFKGAVNVGNNIDGCVAERGVAGFSPIANVVTNGDDVTITITDYKGTTTATVPQSVQWGNITGDINNQTDLGEALDSKQNVLTAGTGIAIENNIISNTQTSAEWGNITGDINNQTDLQNLLDNKANTDFSNITEAGIEVIKENSGGGLEIGDIGIAPLGIDETQGKRRYLNGQLIIQEQYVQFTNKVKSAIALYPSLACTEEEWQATALLTVGGQVGKFVVDDDAGTIRLPKIIMPIQGLTDLSKLAEIVEAGLPDIEGSFGGACGGGTFSGAFTQGSKVGTIASGGGSHYDVSFDASLSNSIYGNSDTVQQEQIQYPYFIQVATGAETEDNIINEIELNNPYTLFDSKYSPNALYNASWLKSEGQWNSGAVYVTCYEGLLVEYNTEIEVGTTTTLPSGTEYTKKGLSVALSTDEYTDYDFVVNTAEETFRLPLLDGSESLPSDRYEDLTLEASGTEYTAPANGWVTLSKTAGASGQYLKLLNITANVSQEVVSSGAHNFTINIPVRKNDVFKADYNFAGVLYYFQLTYAQGNGSLYFYVGETVQNANLINAGRIEEKLVDKVDTNASNFTAEGTSLISSYGMPSSNYIDLTLGVSNSTYTAPANGWFGAYIVSSSGAIYLSNYYKKLAVSAIGNSTIGYASVLVPCLKGDTIQYNYYGTISENKLRFIYAEGEQ